MIFHQYIGIYYIQLQLDTRQNLNTFVIFLGTFSQVRQSYYLGS